MMPDGCGMGHRQIPGVRILVSQNLVFPFAFNFQGFLGTLGPRLGLSFLLSQVWPCRGIVA